LILIEVPPPFAGVMVLDNGQRKMIVVNAASAGGGILEHF
jgi:hypothetical protein